MSAYHNEIDPYCAQWLRNLMKRGHIPDGVVDERSIADVEPGDVAEFAQCHFFAGIAGWPLALRLAGWPEDRPIWTGSCPCQPFSAAGKQRGAADARHLWPEFARLIGECRPPDVAGEQVASKLGRQWLAGVRADLEGMGYAVGAADLGAACVGAPHIRQRLFWVADAGCEQREWRSHEQRPSRENAPLWSEKGLQHQRRSAAHGLGDACIAGLEGRDPGAVGDERPAAERNGAPSFWSNCDWLPCRDGKARRVEPRIQPLAHGVSARVGRLRAYGNAITPQAAAEFLKAYMEAAP